MTFVIIGAFGFVSLLFFDVCSLAKKKYLKYFFGCLGILLIFGSSIIIILSQSNYFNLNLTYRLISLILSLLFLCLLIFSVIIEVGKKTYAKDNRHFLITNGTYALTRHPGVMWMLLLYIFGSFFFQNLIVLYAGLIWTFVNIVYVTIQERYIFNKIFVDYDQYQKTTPMIIPNFQSFTKFFTIQNWRRT